jgi:hypothetical protein
MNAIHAGGNIFIDPGRMDAYRILALLSSGYATASRIWLTPWLNKKST